MKVLPFTTGKEEAFVKEENILSRLYNAPHQHKEMQISLVLTGEGLLTVGSYTQPYKSGDVYIIGANQPHMFRPEKGNGNFEKEAFAVHLYFDYKRIPGTFFLLPELSAVRKFISSCTTGWQLSAEYQVEAAALIQTVHARKNLEHLLGLIELFHYFSNGLGGWKSLSAGFDNYVFNNTEGKRMNDVFQYTFDNYAENITLNKIASVAHITPHAFCKYFKQHTRKTYNSFLNEVRVNEACKKIISDSFDGLSTIAYSTGFKGASNFNRVFKKTTGMSPSDYRKEFKSDEYRVSGIGSRVSDG